MPNFELSKFFKKKINFLDKDNIFCLIIVLFVFLIDRYTKLQVIKNFSEDLYFVNNFININLIWNTGIGFGLFSFDSNILYNILTILILIVITILLYLAIVSTKIEKIIFSLIIGGAIGNFYDRLTFHAVQDFIDLHYKSIHWFTFNVADIFITIGISLYILRGFFEKN